MHITLTSFTVHLQRAHYILKNANFIKSQLTESKIRTSLHVKMHTCEDGRCTLQMEGSHYILKVYTTDGRCTLHYVGAHYIMNVYTTAGRCKLHYKGQ